MEAFAGLHNQGRRILVVFDEAIVWFVAAIIVGLAASNRATRSGFGWFVLSLIISPLLAFLALLAVGRKRPAEVQWVSSGGDLVAYKRTPLEIFVISIGSALAILLLILLVLGMMGLNPKLILVGGNFRLESRDCDQTAFVEWASAAGGFSCRRF